LTAEVISAFLVPDPVTTACMVRTWVADGGDGLQMWRITANILNKQSRTADKGVIFQLGCWARV